MNLARTALAAALLAVPLFAAGGETEKNLIANGSFDDAKNPLAGWTTDYAWTKNSHYVGNKDQVTVEAGVAHMKSPGDAGVKLECIPIPFEPGYRYEATFDVKGGPYRIYFAGYRWRPDAKPHANPKPEELRLIYKSKALAASSKSWNRETISLPGVKLSAAARNHLKYVQFLSLYIWMARDGQIDKVTIKKIPDPNQRNPPD
jgi:hypothetical protein